MQSLLQNGENNAETVENRDKVFAIRIWQYWKGVDKKCHRISVCAGNQLQQVKSWKSFRTRADSRAGNRTRLNGARKKYNVNFIVKAGVFLYNW